MQWRSDVTCWAAYGYMVILKDLSNETMITIANFSFHKHFNFLLFTV